MADLPLCSECGQPFSPAPQNRKKQKTDGTRACKLARIKRLAVLRPEPLGRGQSMQARARKRKADNQRELEYALAGWGPEPIYFCPGLP